MKALSLWQPWASAIQLGLKRVETRSWATSFRGPIAIHAAQTGMGLKLALQHERAMWCNLLGLEILSNAFRHFPRGAIVAVAELVDVVPADAAYIKVPGFTERERALGDYSTGRFAWLLQNVRELPSPIPFRGRQQLFDVPDDLLAAQGVGAP